MSGREFHNQDYIVHSPQQSGTFSDNSEDDREFVLQSKGAETYEDVWGEEEDSEDDENRLDIEEHIRKQKERSIPIDAQFKPLTEIDPRYEETIPEMSKTDKQIVTSLSEYWIGLGVIQRTTGDHGVSTDDDADEMIASAEQAAELDAGLNPDFATADDMIVRRLGDHYSEEVGVNPFEDYDYEEDSAIAQHKEDMKRAEEARRHVDTVDTESMIISEDAHEGMNEAMSEHEIDESEFLHSHVDFVSNEVDDEYSESIENLTAQTERSYERMERLYSGGTRRLATDLDGDADISNETDEEAINADAFRHPDVVQHDSRPFADGEVSSDLQRHDLKKITKYADEIISRYESRRGRGLQYPENYYGDDSDDVEEDYAEEEERPMVSARQPRKTRTEPKRSQRLSQRDRHRSEGSHQSRSHQHLGADGNAASSAVESDEVEKELSVDSTILIMKLIQKGLDNEDIVDVVGNVSAETVERLRQSIY